MNLKNCLNIQVYVFDGNRELTKFICILPTSFFSRVTQNSQQVLNLDVGNWKSSKGTGSLISCNYINWESHEKSTPASACSLCQSVLNKLYCSSCSWSSWNTRYQVVNIELITADTDLPFQYQSLLNKDIIQLMTVPSGSFSYPKKLTFDYKNKFRDCAVNPSSIIWLIWL